MQKLNKKRTGTLLTIAMVIAMLMGPGPGLRLVNPDLSDPGATFTVGGFPIIYAWGLFWFVVQIIIVLIAYNTVWSEADHITE